MDELDLFIDTIRNTLRQPSGRGTSLLCTCLTLTAGTSGRFSTYLVAAVSFAPTRYVISI